MRQTTNGVRRYTRSHYLLSARPFLRRPDRPDTIDVPSSLAQRAQAPA
jgi:hypothetical protein